MSLIQKYLEHFGAVNGCTCRASGTPTLCLRAATACAHSRLAAQRRQNHPTPIIPYHGAQPTLELAAPLSRVVPAQRSTRRRDDATGRRRGTGRTRPSRARAALAGSSAMSLPLRDPAAARHQPYCASGETQPGAGHGQMPKGRTPGMAPGVSSVHPGARRLLPARRATHHLLVRAVPERSLMPTPCASMCDSN